ncbi:hypothetical protein JCM8202_005328 [Rhodotorula sphaerocarpa]
MYAHPERPNKLSEGSNDAAVRSTDVDALVSRCSASSLGYLDDKLASHFLAPSQRRSLERRPPLINIGTHARTWAVDRLVDQFLQVGPHNQKQQPQRQVLSLGAGTDSRFWRIAQRREQQGRDRAEPHEEVCARWVEVDFPEATAAKARAVSTKPDLRKHLGTDIAIQRGGLGLSSSRYALVPGDLRDLPALAASLVGGIEPSRSDPDPPPPPPPSPPPLDPSLPTLLLLECVLVYLNSETTENLLRWFCETFTAPGTCIVAYDPFGLQDQFGIVMRRNLAARSLALPGADSTPTLEALTRRLAAAGAQGSVGAKSIKQIRDECIPRDELQRVAKIEQIDEVEELNLVLEHYAVSWANVAPIAGANGPEGEGQEANRSGEMGLRNRDEA